MKDNITSFDPEVINTFKEKDKKKIRVYEALRFACSMENGMWIKIKGQNIQRNGMQCSYGIKSWASRIEMNQSTLQHIMDCFVDSGIIEKEYDLFDPTDRPENPERMNIKKTLITILINFDHPHLLLQHIKKHQRSHGNPHLPTKKYRGVTKNNRGYEKELVGVTKNNRGYEKELETIDSDSKEGISIRSLGISPATSYEKEERSDDFFVTDYILSVTNNQQQILFRNPPLSLTGDILQQVGTAPITKSEMKHLIGALIHLYGSMYSPDGLNSYFYDSEYGMFVDVVNNEESMKSVINVLQERLNDLQKERNDQHSGKQKLLDLMGMVKAGKPVRKSKKSSEQIERERILKERATKKRKTTRKPKLKVIDPADEMIQSQSQSQAPAPKRELSVEMVRDIYSNIKSQKSEDQNELHTASVTNDIVPAAPSVPELIPDAPESPVVEIQHITQHKEVPEMYNSSFRPCTIPDAEVEEIKSFIDDMSDEQVVQFLMSEEPKMRDVQKKVIMIYIPQVGYSSDPTNVLHRISVYGKQEAEYIVSSYIKVSPVIQITQTTSVSQDVLVALDARLSKFKSRKQELQK